MSNIKTSREKVLSSITKRYQQGTASVTMQTIAQEKNLTLVQVETAVKSLCSEGECGRNGDMVWLLNAEYLFMKYQSESLVRCMPCL